MKWRYFVMLNLLCMAIIGYFSWHIGLAQGKAAYIQNYFRDIQAEEKFLIETINLVNCESGNKHQGVWGDGGRAYGRFQFWKDTFYGLARKTNNEDMKLDWQNPVHQYYIYKEAYKMGEVSKNWTCYKAIDF